MVLLRFEQPSSAPLRTIKEIQFGLLSPAEIKAMSVVKVEYPETMDEQNKGRPREKGLSDPKLGSIDRGFSCGTCGEGMSVCPGHFGHIELAVPVFHVGFITKIKKLLEIVCHNCGKVKLDDSNPDFARAVNNIRDPKRRFDAVHKLCKPKLVCDADPSMDEMDMDPAEAKKPRHGGCGQVQPEIRKEGLRLMGTVKMPKSAEDEDMRGPDKQPITPARAEAIFKLISEEDIKMIGLNGDYARPEWMVITVLPVPPPPVRPSVVVDGGTSGPRGEDDLTYKLGDIIRANQNVQRCEQEGSPAHVQAEFENLLQYHVATYMDNNIAGQPQALQKSGRPVKSIRARLKGKEGRLRGNLMGKRVDFSARTVITGDPNLSLDEVGVPISIAKTLTYPEIVTEYNRHKLEQLVRNGPNEHPGAKYIIDTAGRRVDLRHTKDASAVSLKPGDTVERHIQDGDFIIFNRQPSLHKESMMGHRVRVMPYSTFRLNLSVTSPYNADFDGDEMNLHVPQSQETRAEVSQLCMVPLNIVSPQRNGPLMGIVQDSLAGIYKICKKDVFLTEDHVMNIMLWVPEWDGVLPPPAILKPKARWTGKQIISMIIPTALNLLRVPDKGLDWSPLKDGGLLISNGELMYGMFNKKTVGASGGGVVHVVYNEKGPEAAVKFFNGAQRVVNYWLLHNGFSIGIGDTIPDEPTSRAIDDAVNKRKAEVEKITDDATSGRLEPLPGMKIRETFESKVGKELNSARDDAGSATERGLRPHNNALTMASAGSKGSTINISQMTAVVGQQMVEGKRIPFGFAYRTMPHFCKDDYSPEARGFVENSYLKGLTPTEFFFHAMAGREGLIDTAVKTAETGYIQRRLVKALEDVMTKYDTTVRNSLGDIVQFVYGEDGLDAVYIEAQRLDILKCSNEAFEKKFKIDVMEQQPDILYHLEEGSSLIGDGEVQRLFDEEYELLQKDREFLRWARTDDNETLQLPLNVQRMIETAKTTFRIKDGTRSDLDPKYAIPAVRELLEKLVVVRGDDPLSQEAQESATMLIKAHLRSRLAFKRVVQEYSLNKLAFDNILGDIHNRFSRAQVSPGEMVGVLAAQSIGEPATQMTLNTFHFAGVASKNVTLGVPRLKEILNVATNIKTPSMTIYQAKDKAHSQEACKELRSAVEYTQLRSVTERTEIYYDPVVTDTRIEEDEDIVQAFYALGDVPEDEINRQSKWLLRIVLDRQRLLDKDLTAERVAFKIKEDFGRDLFVIYTDENSPQQVIRLRMVSWDDDKDVEEDEDQEGEGTLRKLEEYLLDELTLRGVPGIERAFINFRSSLREKEDGSLTMSKEDPLCKEWFLDTSGIALKRALQLDGVDPYRTSCNSFVEILSVLGIEATRNSLMRELGAVLSFDGSYVNHRHLALLCDIMTSRGVLMAITRHGINRAETGALMRCSFEETVEILLEAAACGELDDCRGVSENVMLGQMAPLGTGEHDVLLDQDMLNTIVADNAAKGLITGIASGNAMDGAATPYDIGSPMQDSGYGSPEYGASFSPIVSHGADDQGGLTAYGGGYGSDGGFSPYATSPMYAAASPFSAPSPTSPGYSPTSPGVGYSPASPMMGAASPAFAPTSPGFSPASPALGTPASPAYSPASPAFGHKSISPTSPSYSPTSPNYSPTSPNYSPASPNYSPTSPGHPGMGGSSNHYSPASPAYSPTSPAYSPTSPAHPGRSTRPAQNQSPTSPKYSPSSPAGAYSPTSPKYAPSGASPSYSAQSPQWTPTSPTYSPTSPSQ